MRLLRSRRGDWIQIFMIFFFVTILVLSIALLSLEKGKLKSGREQLDADLTDQEASAQLIALLRTPASGGFEGTGKHAQIADIIVINSYDATLQKGVYDDMLLNSFEQVPKDKYFQITMTYPDGNSLIISNTEYAQNYVSRVREFGTAKLAAVNIEPAERSRIVPDALATAQLPAAGGNVQIELLISQKVGTDQAKLRSERVVKQ